jgi:hypothetical protein
LHSKEFYRPESYDAFKGANFRKALGLAEYHNAAGTEDRFHLGLRSPACAGPLTPGYYLEFFQGSQLARQMARTQRSYENRSD